MSHLTPDELIDAAEDALAPTRTAHLTSCAACQHEAAGLRTILRDARAVQVPEPSPFFWDRLSHRVREAIAAEPRPARPWPQWFRWPVLAPLAGLALAVFALVSLVDRNVWHLTSSTGPAAVESAAAPDPETAADAGWALVSDLLGDVDFDTAQEAGIAVAPGSADRAVLELTAAEQQELLRLLQEELKGLGS